MNPQPREPSSTYFLSLAKTYTFADIPALCDFFKKERSHVIEHAISELDVISHVNCGVLRIRRMFEIIALYPNFGFRRSAN